MSDRFSVVIRGYDRVRADAVVALAEAALTSGLPADREAARAEIAAGIPVVLRGYDRGQVDDTLARLQAAFAV